MTDARNPSASTWEPVLLDSSSEAALAFLAKVLASRQRELFDGELSGARALTLSLLVHGAVRAGLKLEREDVGALALSRACDAVETFEGVGLIGGISEVGFVLQHVAADLGVDASEVLSSIDAALEDVLMREGKSARTDLYSGISGVAIYLRGRGANVAHLAERVLALLDALAIRAVDTVRWPSPFRPHETIIGVAHGQAGILAGLVALEKHIAADRLKPLVEKNAAFLASARNIEGEQTLFPKIVPGAGSSRTDGWCAGNAATGLVLARASRAFDSPLLAKLSLAVAQQETRPIGIGPGVLGASLCHGSAGYALTLCRLAELFPALRTQLRERARSWALDALERPYVDEDSHPLLRQDMGLALGLLSLCSGVEPEWDEMLGLSGAARWNN